MHCWLTTQFVHVSPMGIYNALIAKLEIKIWHCSGKVYIYIEREREREKNHAHCIYEYVSLLRLPILVNYYIHQSNNIAITSSNCMVCNANPYIPHCLILS